MDKRKFSNLEVQIMSTVSNALKAIDFANLKRDIIFGMGVNYYQTSVCEYNQDNNCFG